MKLQTTLIIALASLVEIVWASMPMSMSGKPGDMDWGFAPSCARSCLSSAYPTASASWAIPCAATPTSLSNCINSACSITATTAAAVSSAISSVSSIRSSLCSVYSSCSSASQACTWSYPYFGFGGGPFPPFGWQGPGSNGFYTFTCTDGRSSGFSTTTFTVTSTSTGPSGTSVLTSEVTETATLVAAAVGGTGTGTSSSAKSSSTGNSAARQGVLGAGALLAAGVGAVVLL